MNDNEESKKEPSGIPEEIKCNYDKDGCKDSNDRYKNELSVYFEAIKRAEHICDIILHMRQLAFGAGLALPVIGLVKDFISNSTSSPGTLSFITHAS
jgi:hypothetical protein